MPASLTAGIARELHRKIAGRVNLRESREIIGQRFRLPAGRENETAADQ